MERAIRIAKRSNGRSIVFQKIGGLSVTKIGASDAVWTLEYRPLCAKTEPTNCIANNVAISYPPGSSILTIPSMNIQWLRWDQKLTTAQKYHRNTLSPMLYLIMLMLLSHASSYHPVATGDTSIHVVVATTELPVLRCGAVCEPLQSSGCDTSNLYRRGKD